ncbi:MAG: cupin domain-containing protein [Planctomycetota bacterium]
MTASDPDPQGEASPPECTRCTNPAPDVSAAEASALEASAGDDLSGESALRALDALAPDAAAAFDARADLDRELESEVDAYRAVAGEVGGLVPAVAPVPGLWARVLQRVRGQAARGPSTPFAAAIEEVQPTTTSRDALTFQQRDAGDFVPLRVAGVSARTLHRDDTAGYATVLVRMEPGASYPAHRHGDDEECYVLEGDLQVGDTAMACGDYQVAGKGSVHPVQWTRNGCLLLLRSSLHDELLEAS